MQERQVGVATGVALVAVVEVHLFSPVIPSAAQAEQVVFTAVVAEVVAPVHA
jgi:hypothetical protein